MKTLVSVFAVAALATLAAPATFAQVTSATPEVLPRAVTVTLTMPDIRPVKLTMKEGAMARLTRVSDDTTIAIAPTILDESEGLVTAQVFEVKAGLNGTETLTPLGTIDIRRVGQPADPDRAPGREISRQSTETPKPLFGIRMELHTISTTAPASGAPRCGTPRADNFSVQPHGPCYTCCVTCDGWRFCACAVETSCGSCCCIGCC